MTPVSPARRVALIVALLATAAGCGGFKEKVSEVVGHPAAWHLERVHTSGLWALLNRFGFLRRWLGDPGYVGERWWFVSPAGKRSFLRLVNGAAADSRDSDPVAFLPSAAKRLGEAGFNAFGDGLDLNAWAAVSASMPAVACLSLDKWNAGAGQGVFDDWYGPSITKSCDALAASLKDNPAVIGIVWETAPLPSPRALLLAYAGLRGDTASKKRLLAFMRDQCRSDPRQLQNRMPSVRSFDDLAGRTVWDQYELIDQDAEAFARLLLSQYAGKVQAEVHARFPRCLNLGPVLDPDLPIGVVNSLAPYVDALTFAIRTADGRMPRRYLESVHEATGKPVLVLETGQRLKLGTPPVVETPEGMAKALRRGFTGSAGLPFVVGVGWTGYRDTPTEAFGLVDAAGAPREPVVKAATEVNPGLDAIHRLGLAADQAPEAWTDDRFAAGRPTQAIPRLTTSLVVDGDLGEWPKGTGELKAFGLEHDLDPGGFATARVAWTDLGLAVAVEVTGETSALLDPRVYWRGADFVEVFVDGSGRRADGYTPTTLHLALLPRGGGANGRDAAAIAVHHQGDALAADVVGFDKIQVKSSLARGLPRGRGPLWAPWIRLPSPGWTIEALIPWAVMATAPRAEARVGFNLIVNRQRGAAAERMFWASPRGEAALDHPSTWGDLVLKEAAP